MKNEDIIWKMLEDWEGYLPTCVLYNTFDNKGIGERAVDNALERLGEAITLCFYEGNWCIKRIGERAA